METIEKASNRHKAGIKQDQRMYVYILKLDNKSYYTGITNNLERRLKEHTTKQSKSTQQAEQVELIYFVEMRSRKEARWLEVKIKNRGAGRYLRSRTVVNSGGQLPI